MKKTEYSKLESHLKEKLEFYVAIHTNSNRKHHFHGKKYHNVNAFEAAVRIAELKALLIYVELNHKPESFLSGVKTFLKDLFKFKKTQSNW